MAHQIIVKLLQNATNILYVSGIDSKQQLMQKFTPVYYYRNSIITEASAHRLVQDIQLDGINSYRIELIAIYIFIHIVYFDVSGAAHGDDIPYLWYCSDVNFPTDHDDPFVIVRDRVTRMWTNFAKYSNPTPNGTDDRLLNITWPISGSAGYHLEINNELTVGERPIDSTIEKIQNNFNSYIFNL